MFIIPKIDSKEIYESCIMTKDKPKPLNNTFFVMKNTDKGVGIGSTSINVKTLFNLNNL